MKIIKIFLFKTLLMVTVFVSAMEEKSRIVRSLNDIPHYCVQLAKTLSEQPLVVDSKELVGQEGTLFDGLRVLPLNVDDARICELVNVNSINLFRTKSWCIDTSEYPFVEFGYCIRLFPVMYKMCSPEELQKRYTTIVGLLQNNWQRTTLKEHPDIFFKQDENTWDLFIKNKKSYLCEEDVLIRFLASKFNMESQIDCFDIGEDGMPCDEVYLWVKKDAINQFDVIFKFQHN